MLRSIGYLMGVTAWMLSCVSSVRADAPTIVERRAPPPQPFYQPEAPRHVLNGHAFLPSLFLPNEFVDTSAQLGVSVGYGNYDSALLGTTENLKLGAFAPFFEVQAAVSDWLGFTLGFNAHAVAGLNATSAIQYGGSTAYSWRIGVTGRVFRDDKTNLSVAFEIDRPHLLAVSPLEFGVQKVQQYIGSAAPQFPTNGVQTEFRPSLRMVHAFNPVVGIRSLFGFNFQSGDELAARRTGNRLMLGLGMSLDLNPAVNFPLGITANYRRAQIISGGASNADTFEFGLFETVSARFNMGAEIGFTTANGIGTTLGALVAKGYFN